MLVAEALAKIGTKAAIELLKHTFLDDENSLFQFSEEEFQGKRKIQLIFAALMNKDTYEQHLLLDKLGEMGKKEAVEILLQSAIKAINEMGSEEVIHLLIDILMYRGGDDYNRSLAAFILGEIKDSKTIESLRNATLNDPDYRVGKKSIRSTY